MSEFAPLADRPSIVGNSSWLELLHAEVAWHLAQRGVRTIVIKGPSISEWLYALEEARESADVDLLISPDDLQRAHDQLVEMGFMKAFTDTRPGETAHHAENYSRHDAAFGKHVIDLHTSFPGFGVSPDDAFEILWRDRVGALQGNVDVWYPSLDARVLIVALHAARSSGFGKSRLDLIRAIGWADQGSWLGVGQLAAELNAEPALRAGLELIEDPGLIERAGLARVTVEPEWILLTQNAARTAIRLNELQQLPWRERPGQIAMWLFPSPALMEIRDPGSADTRWTLTRAYARRLGQGIAHAPQAVRQLRDARRSR